MKFSYWVKLQMKYESPCQTFDLPYLPFVFFSLSPFVSLHSFYFEISDFLKNN